MKLNDVGILFFNFYDNQSNDNQMSPHYNWMQHSINFDLETMLEIKRH